MITKVIKEPDDTLCTRISIGGDEAFGFYLTYRGDLEKVKKIMYNMQSILEHVTVEAYIPKVIEYDYKNKGE